MRTLNRNRNVTITYCNIIPSESTQTNSWGVPINTYGELKTMTISLLPLDNAADVQEFGLSTTTSLKAVLNLLEAEEFNSFSRIWVDRSPNGTKDNNDYKVIVPPKKSLTSAVMVIEKVTAKNAS